jgi:hypothetical protein
MEIQNSVEGRLVCDELRKELSRLRYNPDLKKMLHNINVMVTELSKLEVVCRQQKNKIRLDDPLIKLNESVTHFRHLLMIAQFME